MKNEQKPKLLFFLPNTFTALNLACGFGSLVLSLKGDLYPAAIVLVLGSIFDLFDGRVARITGTESSFGEQFDSMSDVVSFGVAPAFLMYKFFLFDMGRLGAVAAFVYLLCGALRLARFNANLEKVNPSYFQGLPIPGAALAVVGYVLLTQKLQFPWNKEIALGYVIFYGLLMISNIPFFSFKDSSWVSRNKKKTLFIIFILLGLIFSYYQIMIALLMLIYSAGSIIYFISNRGKMNDVFEWSNEN